MKQWEGLGAYSWRNEIDVRENLYSKTIHPYEGDHSFLADPTEATRHLWNKVSDLLKEERKRAALWM